MAMQVGGINYASFSSVLDTDFVCHLVCKHGDDLYIRPTETAVFEQFSVAGTVSSLEYTVDVEQATPLTTTLSADINATDTTFGVSPDAFVLLAENSYIMVGEEKMVVQSIDSVAGTITVYGRGYGTSVAAAHVAADEDIILLGRVEKTCDDINQCHTFVTQGTIQNAVQRHSWCTTWCTEDLCMLVDQQDKNCNAENFLRDFKDRAIAKATAANTRLLDKIALNGTYASHTNSEGTAGATRGLREYAYGIVDTNGDTIKGIVFDAQEVADNSCFDNSTPDSTAATSTISYDLLQKYFDRVHFDFEGFHDIVFVSANTAKSLRDVIMPCQEDCVVKGSAGEGSAFRNINVIAAPWGNIEVIVSKNVRDDEAIFATRRNLKIYGYCFNGTAIFNRKEYATDFSGKNIKNETTGFFAFDASQNMCSELGILRNFTQVGC